MTLEDKHISRDNFLLSKTITVHVAVTVFEHTKDSGWIKTIDNDTSHLGE